MMVQTPDFVAFANELANCTSRNSLILKSNIFYLTCSEANDAQQGHESKPTNVKYWRG